MSNIKIVMIMCDTNQNSKHSELISLLFVFPTINVSRIPNLSCLPQQKQLAAELFYNYDYMTQGLGYCNLAYLPLLLPIHL